MSRSQVVTNELKAICERFLDGLSTSTEFRNGLIEQLGENIDRLTLTQIAMAITDRSLDE